MKILNSGKKGISNLTNKTLRAAKTRNIISIIAITLTTLLFTSVFTLGAGFIEQLEYNAMLQSGSSAHGIIKSLTPQQYENIKNHPLIEEIGYENVVGEIENGELLKQATFFSGADKNSLEMSFAEPTVGRVPFEEREIISDDVTLKLMGIPLKIGSIVPLRFSVNGVDYEDEFILSGYYKREPRLAVSMIYCAPVYADNLFSKYTDTDKSFESKTINARIMFGDKSNIVDSVQTIIKESGYSTVEGNDNYIDYNNNWAYMQINSDTDPFMLISIFFVIIIIIFAGYLIIYNIFQINVYQNIRFYGLLKTIGVTHRQIKRMLLDQIMVLAAFGIPLGLVLGYFAGIVLMPVIMKESTFYYDGMKLSVTANPVIFIIAGILSFITILISIRKPNKIASKISPMEALKFDDIGARNLKKYKSRSIKKTRRTGNFQMAIANMVRSKKQVILTVMSLSLCLILLNSIFTLVQSFSMEKYLSKYINTNFRIAHAQYFQFGYEPIEHTVSTEVIASIENLDGFIEGYKIYYGSKNADSFNYYVTDIKDSQESEYINAEIYGADSKILKNLVLLDGKIDLNLLNSGDYILEPILANDEGIADISKAQYKLGDKIKLYSAEASSNVSSSNLYREVEVIGHVQLNWFTDTKRHFSGQMFYTSTEGMEILVKDPAIMTYSFNVENDKKTVIENWMYDYTTHKENALNYESEEIYKEKFLDLKSTIISIGIVSCSVIGFIGIVNFINFTLTNIFVRKREFAMMQSVGMTKKQLIYMLSTEGLYYAVITIFVSLVISTMCSLIFLKIISMQIWFMDYTFTIVPILICILPLIIFAIILPIFVYKSSDNQTIVERLRLVD